MRNGLFYKKSFYMKLLFVFVLIAAGCGFYLLQVSADISGPADRYGLADPNIRVFQVEAKNYEFSPAVLNAKLNEKVRIYVTSTDMTHGFALPDFNIDVTIVPGPPKLIEFIADRQGVFGFYSSVYSGEGWEKMKGKVVVE